jgi:predicted phosphodiesterase
MMVAVFSDVHGNLPALERFARSTAPVADRYVCLGDVVNYGPWNDECLELVSSLPGIAFVEGNHERLFLGTAPVAEEIALVQEFYQHSIRSFTRRDLIAGLPTSFQLDRFVCTHTIEGRKVYVDTEIEVTSDCMIGHSHQQYQIERSGKWIVNPGSIGQNRSHIDIVNYALYDTSSGKVTLREEFCPIDRFVAELAARGYPETCINYYQNKRRGLP